jgi:multiple sugar transport system ATP-binding protein
MRLTIPVLPGDVRTQTELTLGVRPEHIALDGPDDHPGARLLAEVMVVEHLGGEILAHVKLQDGAALCVKAFGDTPLLHRGQRIPLVLRPELCYLFTADGAALSPLRPRPIHSPQESQGAPQTLAGLNSVLKNKA